MALIKIKSRGKDVVFNTDYLVSVVDDGYNRCIIRLAKGEKIEILDSAQSVWRLIKEAEDTT